MKTKIKVVKDCKYGDFKKGDIGYIDGYTMNNGFDTAVLILANNSIPQLSHLRDRQFEILNNNFN